MIEAVLLAGSVAAQGVCIAAVRASEGLRRRWWVAAAFVAMAVSVMWMSQALAHGLSLAVGYGIWSGSGILLAAVAGAFLFGDRPARLHLLGLVLVVLGVVAVYGGGG